MDTRSPCKQFTRSRMTFQVEKGRAIPKVEIRNPKEIRNSKAELTIAFCMSTTSTMSHINQKYPQFSAFGIFSDFGPRISDFSPHFLRAKSQNSWHVLVDAKHHHSRAYP